MFAFGDFAIFEIHDLRFRLDGFGSACVGMLDRDAIAPIDTFRANDSTIRFDDGHTLVVDLVSGLMLLRRESRQAHVGRMR